MKRALIVKLGAIGDVIMAVPAVFALHQQGYAVDWIAGPAVAPLLRCYSWIRVIQADDKAVLTGSPMTRMAAVAAVWRQITGERYDLLATLYYDLRWRVFSLPVRAERHLKLSRTDRSRSILPTRSHADEFARMLLDRKDTCRDSSLQPLRPDQLPPSPIPQPAGRRIAMVPAGASNMVRQQTLRRWPAERYAAIAATLLDRGDEVVLLGGPDDTWVRESFRTLNAHPRLLDRIGATTLPGFVSLADELQPGAVARYWSAAPCRLEPRACSGTVRAYRSRQLSAATPRRACAVGRRRPCMPPLLRRPQLRVLRLKRMHAVHHCRDSARHHGPDARARRSNKFRHPQGVRMNDGSPARPLRPGLFLDRDGVINKDTNFLYRAEECELIEGIGPLIRTANQLGYVTCVITNQSGIGRGLYTEQDFHRLMDHMSRELEQQGARLDAVYFSPYHPVHGIGAYQRESDCRKPAPGMLLRAAEEHDIDLAQSVLVGDRCTDLLAGNAAGVPKLFLFGSTEPDCCASDITYNAVNKLFTVQSYLLATRGK